ncbi:MAG: biopolymer transporter ExbD [Gammaproteobacteria bacterium]|nr:biopolymer transporter ExbD [Gammaproteobacteria bacterium]
MPTSIRNDLIWWECAVRRIIGGHGSEEGDEQINLTPMLDVVFIMLIFFIVTATFVKEVGLDVNQPDDEPMNVDPKKKNIVVRISNRDRIVIAQRDVDWRSVRANIERLHAENPEAPVVIQPHPDSQTATMIHVMDSARLAGVFNISLASN